MNLRELVSGVPERFHQAFDNPDAPVLDPTVEPGTVNGIPLPSSRVRDTLNLYREAVSIGQKKAEANMVNIICGGLGGGYGFVTSMMMSPVMMLLADKSADASGITAAFILSVTTVGVFNGYNFSAVFKESSD